VRGNNKTITFRSLLPLSLEKNQEKRVVVRTKPTAASSVQLAFIWVCTMTIQSLFNGLYVVGMAIGALHFWVLSRHPKGVPQYEYLIAISIPIWSGLAYLAMTINQGKVEVLGQVTHYARYIDWAITTPLLLLALSLTAMQFIKKDWTLISALMGTQFIVVVAGLVADLSEREWARSLWYFCGVVAFLIVLQGIWGPLRKKSKLQTPALGKLYDRLLVYFTIFWCAYPVVWIVGPSGLGAINQVTETFLFCLFPFFSKVGFSILDLEGLRDLRASNGESRQGRRATNLGVSKVFKILDWITRRRSLRKLLR